MDMAEVIGIRRMSRKTALALAAIVLAGALARAIFCFEVVGFRAPLRGDEVDYHALAASVASGRGFSGGGGEPTAGRPPLWPLVLAGAYRIGGARPETGRILAIVLGTLLVPLAFAAARRAFPGRNGAALLAALLVAGNPSLVFTSGYLLSESLAVALMLVSAMLVAGRDREERSLGRFLLAGVLFGLGSLARPTIFPVALLAAAGIAIAGAGAFTARLARATVLVAGLAAACAPWAIRNESRLGAPVLFTTHGGITFYQGNNRLVIDERAYRGGVAPIAALPGWDGILAKDGEIERDREAWRLGKAFLAENRPDVPRMLLWKFLRFWRFNAESGLSGVKSGWWWDKGRTLGRAASAVDVVFAYSIVAIPLFLAGLALAAREARRLLVYHAIVLVHTATALVFYGSLRSRAPVEPVIAIFASYAIARIAAAARSAARR